MPALFNRLHVGLVSVTFLLLASNTAQAIPIRVDSPTARTLEKISTVIEGRTSQMKVRCSGSEAADELCTLTVKNEITPRIRQELIGHPLYDDRLIAYRATGGTPEYRRALFEALAATGSPTNEFSPGVMERKLNLQNGGIRIRCTETMRANPDDIHQCWFIIHADLLVLDPTSPPLAAPK